MKMRKYSNGSRQRSCCDDMKMADGGRVPTKQERQAANDAARAARKEYSKADPGDVGTGMANNAANALRYGRKRQEEELGLKDGGRVRKAKC